MEGQTRNRQVNSKSRPMLGKVAKARNIAPIRSPLLQATFRQRVDLRQPP